MASAMPFRPLMKSHNRLQQHHSHRLMTDAYRPADGAQ
jgi:hypothetical protein